MNAHFLKADAESVKALIANLFAKYPELEEDAELRADVLEGETDLNRLVDFAVREALDAKAMAEARKARIDDLSSLKARSERKAAAMRDLVKGLMKAAQLTKIALPDATVSVTKARQSVEVTDIDALPQGFFTLERKAKSAEIKAALDAGEIIPGAELKTGDEGLTVRSK